MKRFDFDLAEKIIEGTGAVRAFMGIFEDWKSTEGMVYSEGKYFVDPGFGHDHKVNGISGSVWGTPIIIVELPDSSLVAYYCYVQQGPSEAMPSYLTKYLTYPTGITREDIRHFFTPATKKKKKKASKVPSQGALNKLSEDIYRGNVLAGWWSDLETGAPKDRNVGELLCLVHSEISEAMEGYRKDLMDDKLLHRKMFEVELADALIRIFDIAGHFKLDLDGAVAEKRAYNARRDDHKKENRAKMGGKKF